MTAAPKVALDAQLIKRLAELPPAVNSRVVKWIVNFMANPTSNGINYERIKAARDPHLRSVRIDQDWRSIVFKPDQGNEFILLHVDKHDPAYRWAEKIKLSINPATGALQVVNLAVVDELPTRSKEPVTATPSTAPDPQASTPPSPCFASLTDDELLQLGTPVELVALVRSVMSEDELDRIREHLPLEAYEGLFLALAGDTVSQILSAREARVDRKIDTNDFDNALATPESQSRFIVVTSDAELLAILNAPLAQWRTFLHPTQRRLASGHRSGPVRVLGGAGTGKTVLAMHRAKWLAKNVASRDRRVLFTTFTRNLAVDVQENLKSLFVNDPDVSNIEVMNLDRWVSQYLRRKDYPHKIIYKRDERAWRRALETMDSSLGLDEAFYEDEWEQVVAAQGVRTLDDYRRATRVGRRTVLNRAKRDRIWPVFEEYRLQLSSQRLKDVDDAYGDAAQLLANDKGGTGYCGVVVDETQDFGPAALRLIRAIVPPGSNDLFFVGDGHQRIYPKYRASLGKCGIDIRGRARKLYLNYRTTEEIRRAAVALLENRDIDDLDGGSDDNRRYKSLSTGPAPEARKLSSPDEALRAAVERVISWRKEESGQSASMCIVAPSNHQVEALLSALRSAGMPAEAIDAETADSASSDKVRVATMHRAKGLEFDRVIVVAPESQRGRFANWDQLVYVSLTRARKLACILR
jgi:hypothetical protein